MRFELRESHQTLPKDSRFLIQVGGMENVPRTPWIRMKIEEYPKNAKNK